MRNNPRVFISIYLLFPAVTAFTLLFTLPIQEKSTLITGLSRSWLLVAAILFTGAIIFIALAGYAWQHTSKLTEWVQIQLNTRRSLLTWLATSMLIFISACILLNIPDKYLGKFWAIAERINPLLIWILLISLQVFVSLCGWQINQRKQAAAPRPETVKIFSIAFGLFALLWILIANSGLGIKESNSFWSKAGVPLLWPQIFFALGSGLALQIFIKHIKTRKEIWLDILLIIVLWTTAVVVWNQQTYIQGVFDTAPRPPANEIYPINDSLIYDSAAQNMLVGQEMNYAVTDKPVYITFLSILHLLAGNSSSFFYLLQILCLAFIPVCGYLIGKSLHSRPLGVIFAILLILKEQNAIALTNYIQVSTSKMILSEMLTALGLLLFTLFLIRWLISPRLKNPDLWIAGGMLGLSSLVRLNSAGVLPLAIIIVGLAVKFKWQQWFGAVVLLSVFMVISATPWLGRNFVISKNAFSFINNKTGGVIVNQRYDPVLQENTPSTNNSQPSPNTKITRYLTFGPEIATNYLHNLIGITVMLPPSFELYKLLDLVRLPYWKLDWDGRLLPGAFWIITGILSLTALGIASAWMRHRAAGLAPLAVILGYNITTAISLTSGGRYLVPIDWGVLLYFSIGMLEAILWLLSIFGWAQTEDGKSALTSGLIQAHLFPKLIMTGLFFLFLGSTPLLMENLPPQSYPPSVTLTDFLEANQSLPDISSKEMNNNITVLSKDPLMRILHGKALYPRYYGKNKGEGPTLEQDPLIGSAGFDHLSFLLIGGKSDETVLLPTSNKLFQQIAGANAWIIGCQRENYIEATLTIFRTKNTASVYQVEPFKTSCE